MDSVVYELNTLNSHIESAYLIGSYDTKYERPDSDIDIVLIIKEKLTPSQISLFKKKNHGIDLILLDMHCIEREIKKAPSHYVSAINQIKLNPRKIYGSSFIDQYSLCPEKIEINQLYFPLFAIKKILFQNKVESNRLTDVLHSFEMFKKLKLGSAFSVIGKTYYSYRTLSTLLFTLCSYKLIQYNIFNCNRPGKQWFIDDYLQHCKEDSFYPFLHNYQRFTEIMMSNVFDRSSRYLEHQAFKFQLFNLFNEYWKYLSSRCSLDHL
jgi:hypothetical protein